MMVDVFIIKERVVMKKLIVFSLVAVVAFVGSVVFASRHVQFKDPNVSYRVNVMAAIGANMGAMGDIFKHRLPHQDAVGAHARNIERSGMLIVKAFQKEAMEEDSTALPKIWKEFDMFKAKAEDMVEAAGALAKAADSGDQGKIMGAMKGLGDTCKGCHKEYRKKRN